MKTGHVPLSTAQLETLGNGGELRVRLRPDTMEMTISLKSGDKEVAQVNDLRRRVESAIGRDSRERRG